MSTFDSVGFMEGLDAAKALLEFVAGYRAECEAKGFSPTAAEVMALEFHKHLIAGAFNAPKATS